uniref:Uncharacterized protein n=1 Tax=Anopheles culicifacies TaxID=139723 RepID=A0A182M0R1_9DIPT
MSAEQCMTSTPSARIATTSSISSSSSSSSSSGTSSTSIGAVTFAPAPAFARTAAAAAAPPPDLRSDSRYRVMVRKLGSSNSPSLINDLYAWMPMAVLIFIAATIIGSRHFRLRSSSAVPTDNGCGDVLPTMAPDCAVPVPPVILPNLTDMRFNLRLVACNSLRVTSSAVRRAESGRSSIGATIETFPTVRATSFSTRGSGGGGGGGGSNNDSWRLPSSPPFCSSTFDITFSWTFSVGDGCADGEDGLVSSCRFNDSAEMACTSGTDGTAIPGTYAPLAAMGLDDK